MNPANERPALHLLNKIAGAGAPDGELPGTLRPTNKDPMAPTTAPANTKSPDPCPKRQKPSDLSPPRCGPTAAQITRFS